MADTAYEIVWSDDMGNVILCYFREGITWELYHPAIEKLMHEVQSRDARVDVIFVGEATMPRGNPFPHFRRALTLLHENKNLGLVITTGAGINRFTMMIGDVVFRAMGLDKDRYKFSPTLEQSYDYIKEDRGVPVS